MTNTIVPSTLPCGMPLRILAQVDNLPFTTTRCRLSEKKFSIQVRRPPFMPYVSAHKRKLSVKLPKLLSINF